MRLAVELGAASVDHCTHLTDADVDALAGRRHRRDAAARRRVLHPLAVPGRPPAAGRRGDRRAGHRLQPRHLLLLVDAVLIALAVREMRLTPAEALHAATAGAARGAAPHGRRRRRARRAAPTSRCSTPRATSTWPTGRASRSPARSTPGRADRPGVIAVVRRSLSPDDHVGLARLIVRGLWRGFVSVTWNHAAGWSPARWRHRRPRPSVACLDGAGGEVAGPGSARAGGRVAADLGRSGSGTAHDRRLCPRAGEFLQVCERDGIDPLAANRAQVAAFVRDLTGRPSRRGGNVVALDSGAGLANATLQQRLVPVRLFYDFLIEEGLRESNPVGRGRYTPGRQLRGGGAGAGVGAADGQAAVDPGRAAVARRARGVPRASRSATG